MNHAQINLIQESFEQLVPSGDEALEGFFGEIFYQRLQMVHPKFKPLLGADSSLQGQKLLKILRTAITKLDQDNPNTELLESELNTIAICSTMIWTLETTMGEDFTPELRQAWTATYGLLAQALQKIE